MKKVFHFTVLILLNIVMVTLSVILAKKNSLSSHRVAVYEKIQKKYQRQQRKIQQWHQLYARDDIQQRFVDLFENYPNFLLKDQDVCANEDNIFKGFSSWDGYLSGYVMHNDCLNLLKDLAKTPLPIWIKTLTIQRSITSDYRLRVSLTYKFVKPLK